MYFFLDTTRKKLRWPQVGGDQKNSKNGWVTNNVSGGGGGWSLLINGGFDPSTSWVNMQASLIVVLETNTRTSASQGSFSKFLQLS